MDRFPLLRQIQAQLRISQELLADHLPSHVLDAMMRTATRRQGASSFWRNSHFDTLGPAAGSQPSSDVDGSNPMLLGDEDGASQLIDSADFDDCRENLGESQTRDPADVSGGGSAEAAAAKASAALLPLAVAADATTAQDFLSDVAEGGDMEHDEA